MGGSYSSAVAVSRGGNVLPLPKRSGQVISFHSSAKWKSHYRLSSQRTKLMVVGFTAVWCGPCRTMEPIIRDFAATYVDVEFIKIDVDELEDVARGYGVQLMPTFILLKKGKEVDRVVGAKKEELQNKIEKYMA